MLWFCLGWGDVCAYTLELVERVVRLCDNGSAFTETPGNCQLVQEVYTCVLIMYISSNLTQTCSSIKDPAWLLRLEAPTLKIVLLQYSNPWPESVTDRWGTDTLTSTRCCCVYHLVCPLSPGWHRSVLLALHGKTVRASPISSHAGLDVSSVNATNGIDHFDADMLTGRFHPRFAAVMSLLHTALWQRCTVRSSS